MALPVNDTFTRGNETPLAGNYTHIQGGGATINLSGNALITATLTNSDAAYYWNADTFANDQWGSIDVTTWNTATGLGAWVGIDLRSDNTGGTVRTHYWAAAGGSGTPGFSGSVITRRLIGVKTTLASEAATNWGAAPFTVYAEVIGDVINIRQGSSSGTIVLTFTDTGGIASGNVGPFMAVFDTAPFTDVICDNFQAGDVSAVATLVQTHYRWREDSGGLGAP